MAHASPLDSTIGKAEEHPEQRPPVQTEAEELSDEQLQAVSGERKRKAIQPCL
jgi:hypothetical protein